MTDDYRQLNAQDRIDGELQQRGGIAHDATLVGVTTLANYGVGPLVEQGVEWLQDQFKHDQPPPIVKAPGYDHDK